MDGVDDGLWKALLGGFDPSLDPYGALGDPNQLLNALYGPGGESGGTQQGPWGALLGGIVPQMNATSPFGSMSPKPDWGNVLHSIGLGHARQ